MAEAATTPAEDPRAAVDERARMEIAARAMQGLLSAHARLAFDKVHDERGLTIDFADGVARNAVRYADALLAALDTLTPTKRERR